MSAYSMFASPPQRRCARALEILHAEDRFEAERWDHLVSASAYHDVYYRSGYALACQVAGHGRAIAVVITTSRNSYLFPMLQRPLPYKVLGDSGERFDTITPYGYGGILPLEGPLLAEDLDECLDALKLWCRDAGVVSCYLRLHPLFQQERAFQGLARPDLYRLVHGPTIAIEPSCWDAAHDRIAGMNRSRRLQLTRARHALRASWETRDLASFREVYEDCMRRTQADSWYLFPPSYYEVLTLRLTGRWKMLTILQGDEVVGTSILLHEGSFLHGHLNGITEEGRRVGASTLLHNEAASWARANGLILFHIGGGRREGDSLYQYKASYGGRQFRYETAGLIVDSSIYSKLTALHQSSGSAPTRPNHFPAYRA